MEGSKFLIIFGALCALGIQATAADYCACTSVPNTAGICLKYLDDGVCESTPCQAQKLECDVEGEVCCELKSVTRYALANPTSLGDASLPNQVPCTAMGDSVGLTAMMGGNGQPRPGMFDEGSPCGPQSGPDDAVVVVPIGEVDAKEDKPSSAGCVEPGYKIVQTIMAGQHMKAGKATFTIGETPDSDIKLVVELGTDSCPSGWTMSKIDLHLSTDGTYPMTKTFTPKIGQFTHSRMTSSSLFSAAFDSPLSASDLEEKLSIFLHLDVHCGGSGETAWGCSENGEVGKVTGFRNFGLTTNSRAGKGGKGKNDDLDAPSSGTSNRWMCSSTTNVPLCHA